MDVNQVTLVGRLATPPERRDFESGTYNTRLLVTVRSDNPRRRLDVIPVVIWDTPISGMTIGDTVLVEGTVQRRFWEGEDGRRSRLEIVANLINVLTPPEEDDA